MRRTFRFVACLLAATAVAQSHEAQTPRVDPPEFTPEEEAVFFDDAFAELVGERPEYGVKSQTNDATASGGVGPEAAWADLVDPDVIETEIKRQAQRLTGATASAARFNGGGYREASDALGLVSTLMAVTDQHLGEPRWRDAAADYRDLFAEGEGLKANDESYEQAKARAADLTDLIRGARPNTPQPSAEADWSTLGGRGGLMRRMAVAQEERLPEMLSDRRMLRRSSEEIRHEAQLLALLAEALLQPGAYDSEDADYQALARALRQAALELESAADSGDLEGASEALRAAGQACADCHEGYRG